MKSVSVTAAEKTTNIRTTAQEVQIGSQSSVPTMAMFKPSFGVVIESNTYSMSIERRHEVMDTGLKQFVLAGTGPAVIDKAPKNSVLIETRPVAVDNAMRTQRLNLALQVGYFTPIQETSPKSK